MLTRAQIEARIPHAGAMCLLDSVQSWDDTHIDCQAARPAADHPLARAGGVPAVAAVEYAAQAAAVHGALLDGAQAPREGRLAKLAEVEIATAMLGDAGGPIEVRAGLVSRLPSGCMYTFEVRDAGRSVASGRLLIAFAA